ncbi:MAG: TadE family protein [candidate division FCPU426 bacterium]
MKPVRRNEQGQAVVELALVVFLFAFFATGIIQLVWIGMAQLRCQTAAREAAKLVNLFNNTNMRGFSDHVPYLLPGCRLDTSAPGNSDDEGRVVTVRYTVQPIGFFRLLRPQGFEVSAKSAVIAKIQTPKAAELIRRGFDALQDLVNELKN